MITKISSLIVVCLLTLSITSQHVVAASPRPEKDTPYAQKIEAAILELGTGRTSRVSIKLRDRTKLAGYVSEIGDSSFVVTDFKTAAATTVAYPDVVQIKGNNLSTGAKIAITVAIVVAVIIVLYSVKGAFCDGC